MPYYTFKCPECEDVKEVLQKNQDPPQCDECTKMVPRHIVKMERVWGGVKVPGIKYNCDGFYETDYKPKIGGTHSSPEAALKAHEEAKGKSK